METAENVLCSAESVRKLCGDAATHKSETPEALAGATGANDYDSGEADCCNHTCVSHERQAFDEAVRLSVEFADAVGDLPDRAARIVVEALLGAVDDVRDGMGREPVRATMFIVEPVKPDFLKGRDDWRNELMTAWRALPQDDRAAFLARVTSRRAAA